MPFEPIRTPRLVLRTAQASDADALFERRRLPEVARYQGWELPYRREQAEAAVAQWSATGFPDDGEGGNLTVVDAEHPERILGDVYVGISAGGRCAEVGFTFHPDHWGRGYATEATAALLRHLFVERDVRRVEASLHPDNVASARVLEACGFRAEGVARQAFWLGDEASDDLRYGLLRAEWEAWCGRPRHRPQLVELVPITPDNVRAVGELATHRSQERFVSPMPASFRDALVPPLRDGAPVVPWYRAIVADGVIAGFLLAAERTDAHPNPYLWRFLVDRSHQRRGIGSAALEQFERRCFDEGAAAIEVSWVEGPGSPAPMYLARGYEPSGRIDDGEVHAVKRR